MQRQKDARANAQNDEGFEDPDDEDDARNAAGGMGPDTFKLDVLGTHGLSPRPQGTRGEHGDNGLSYSANL